MPNNGTLKKKQYGGPWREAHREHLRSYNTERRARLKAVAFSVYGEACECCGENRKMFLVIDHIDGGGSLHRRSPGGPGHDIYHWLHTNKYPVGFRTLCHNCNFAVRLGVCPHQSGDTDGN